METSMSIKSTGILKLSMTTVIAGLGMWVVAGLYHNLVLPLTNPAIEAHHDGLVTMLIAYIILAVLMVYLYSTSTGKSTGKRQPLIEGIKLGGIIGILWTFPHGLALAGIHGTSITYEVLNSLWHVVEQGIGGAIIAALIGRSRIT